MENKKENSKIEETDKKRKHLLEIRGMGENQINAILDKAEFYFEENKKQNKKHNIMRGKTQINLFFEESTRTQSSFELAGKRLGADVVNMAIKGSSVKKGETLLDTAMTLNAMRPDVLVIRHYHAGAGELLAQKLDCSVINAGDGAHEHPTQALLDALTIRRKKGHIKNLKIAICGDILHSRVARSNIALLKTLGAQIQIAAPATLIPENTTYFNAKIFNQIKPAIKNCDVVMMLRLQSERMQGDFVPSPREYYKFFGLNEENLKYAKKNVLVMHPGPINRGIEIDSAVADGPKSVIHEQVEIGVATRMAILHMLTQ